MKLKTKPAPRVIKTTTRPNYAAINAALEAHLDLAWSEKNQSAIKRDIGPTSFSLVEEIIGFTSNQDAWLNDQSLSAAADKVSGRLSQHYPWLSPPAVFRIINQATYGWK